MVFEAQRSHLCVVRRDYCFVGTRRLLIGSSPVTRVTSSLHLCARLVPYRPVMRTIYVDEYESDEYSEELYDTTARAAQPVPGRWIAFGALIAVAVASAVSRSL